MQRMQCDAVVDVPSIANPSRVQANGFRARYRNIVPIGLRQVAVCQAALMKVAWERSA